MERSVKSGDDRKGPTLRMGSTGEPVRRLQQRLKELGYDPGPLDGRYGWLTFAAVRDFQRDFRLDADGVVGRRTRTILFDKSLTTNRASMIVAELVPQSGRAMALRTVVRQAAGLAAISVPVPIESLEGAHSPESGKTSAGSGQPSRPAAHPSRRAAGPAIHLGEQVRAGVAAADELIAQFQAVLREPISAWTTIHNRAFDVPGQYPRGSLQTLLHAPGSTSRLEAMIEAAAMSTECQVIHLDFGRVRWGDGARFLRFVKRAASAAAAAHKQLAVSLPLQNLDAPWARLSNDLDYAAVSALVSYVVLVPPAHVGASNPTMQPRSNPFPPNVPRPPASREISAWVRSVVRRVPPWRCLLEVPLGAMVFPTGERRSAMGWLRSDATRVTKPRSAKPEEHPLAPPTKIRARKTRQRRAGRRSRASSPPASEPSKEHRLEEAIAKPDDESAARSVRQPNPSSRERVSYQLPYQRAVALAYGAGTRPQWDDTVGRPMFRGRFGEREEVVWLETFASIASKVDIVGRYRLAGLYLTSVGAEDVRIWRVLRERLLRAPSSAS